MYVSGIVRIFDSYFGLMAHGFLGYLGSLVPEQQAWMTTSVSHPCLLVLTNYREQC
jgi:hypothetical protein